MSEEEKSKVHVFANLEYRGSEPIALEPDDEKYVGFYRLGSMTIGLDKKPNWFHRFFMKICFGWTWEDQ